MKKSKDTRAPRRERAEDMDEKIFQLMKARLFEQEFFVFLCFPGVRDSHKFA